MYSLDRTACLGSMLFLVSFGVKVGLGTASFGKQVCMKFVSFPQVSNSLRDTGYCSEENATSSICERVI